MLLARVLMASLFVVLGGWRVWGALNGMALSNAALVLSVGELLLGQFHRSVTSLVRSTAGLEETFRALSVVSEARRSFAEGKRSWIEF
jgi:hypothetical protein